jgi:hypothetical protein
MAAVATSRDDVRAFSLGRQWIVGAIETELALAAITNALPHHPTDGAYDGGHSENSLLTKDLFNPVQK